MGHGSFKGMGIDFADLNHNGKFDMVVSNITSAWGLEESNFAWMNNAKNPADARKQLADGDAPFTQKAQEMGLAWTGWGWDVKAADFRNDGNLEILQAEGFIKGTINRWPWLQELAMSNDQIYTNPNMWPHAKPGDDIAGSQPMAFYTRRTSNPTGTYVNVTKQLGLATPIPSRGLATADTRGDGALDFAVARQWGPPAFYANNTPNRGNFLGLNLIRPVAGAKPGQDLQAAGSPAYGATVQIRTPDGRTQISRLDGGGGHSGKRSFEVHFGLGDYSGPVSVQLQWCQAGQLRTQTVSLTPGNHTLSLDSMAKEVTTS